MMELSEKNVLEYLSGIDGIVEFYEAKELEYLRACSEFLISGKTDKAIGCSSLAKYFAEFSANLSQTKNRQL